MKNLWPSNFEIQDSRPVKEILDEQGSFLPELTGGMVLSMIKEMDATEQIFNGHKDDFSYSYYIRGRFLKKYSFKVMDFSHPITMYPVFVTVDQDIANSLSIDEHVEVASESDFIALIETIFRSEKLMKIIGSIMKLSPSKVKSDITSK